MVASGKPWSVETQVRIAGHLPDNIKNTIVSLLSGWYLLLTWASHHSHSSDEELFPLHILCHDAGVCPEPGGLPFSTRTRFNGPYFVGSNVSYSCFDGVRETMTCQSDGEWTSKPICNGASSFSVNHLQQKKSFSLSKKNRMSNSSELAEPLCVANSDIFKHASKLCCSFNRQSDRKCQGLCQFTVFPFINWWLFRTLIGLNWNNCQAFCSISPLTIVCSTHMQRLQFQTSQQLPHKSTLRTREMVSFVGHASCLCLESV